MYVDYDDINYHEDEDIDLSDYEIVEDEESLERCNCVNGCNNCLMLSY